MKKKSLLFTLLLIFVLLCSACSAKRIRTQIDVPGALDRILLYEIEVGVNDDATVHLDYHIEWQVLDSSSEGPLEWVKIGVPNSTVFNIIAESNSIEYAYYYSDSGSYVRLDLDRKYYSDEVVSLDFSMDCDNMYEMNALAEGESVFYFTPGWFTGMAVDKLVVRWNGENALGWSSGAYQDENGYIVWELQDITGITTERSVTYSNTAYAFDTSKTIETGDYSYDYSGWYGSYDSSDYYSSYQTAETIFSFSSVFVFAIMATIIIKIIKGVSIYTGGSGFSSGSTTTTKKITRTLIKYYPTCPGCGAVRNATQEKCEYCGRSFIESEEVVEEKEIKEPEKYSSEGTYSYGSIPDTYIRVHVVNVPAPRPPRSSCVHSSCAHSSCACAHSCACACACACAGGGRAGCSTKDFYNTGLKLKQFEKRKRK